MPEKEKKTEEMNTFPPAINFSILPPLRKILEKQKEPFAFKARIHWILSKGLHSAKLLGINGSQSLLPPKEGISHRVLKARHFQKYRTPHFPDPERSDMLGKILKEACSKNRVLGAQFAFKISMIH